MCEVEELLEKRLAVPCEDSAAIKLSQTSRLLRGIIFDGMLVRSLRKVSLSNTSRPEREAIPALLSERVR